MNPPNALPPELLLATGLTLSRGGRTLFTGLTVRLSKWGMVLVRGPNGAGKSSLLLTLAGILRPETGTIQREWPGEAENAMHFLGHQSGIKTRLTVGENLRFWRQVNGPTGLEVEPALERVGLHGLSGIEAGHLSAGQTRRLGLARLLVTKRPVWLLDEPTASLDAAGHELVGRLLSEHTASGGGAIIATHDAIPGTEAATILTLGAA
jgi:heme exporter protein A